MNRLEILLRLAGLLQFPILIAGALVPRVLDWRRNLAPLHPFLRSLFWVYGAFIMMVVMSFGTLTLIDARAMAVGEPVARSLAAFIALFWGARLGVQMFVFDSRPFLTNRLLKAGYHCLTLGFVFFTAIYGWAALFPMNSRSL